MPEDEMQSVELKLELEHDVLTELRRRAEADELAPVEDDSLLRYLVYLGAGYVEAERVVEKASSWDEAYAALHRLYGAAEGEASVLQFHYTESARGFAEEERARPAHERMGDAYMGLVELMEAEAALRERRIGNLEKALRR
jgi:hypothetical protein